MIMAMHSNTFMDPQSHTMFCALLFVRINVIIYCKFIVHFSCIFGFSDFKTPVVVSLKRRPSSHLAWKFTSPKATICPQNTTLIYKYSKYIINTIVKHAVFYKNPRQR